MEHRHLTMAKHRTREQKEKTAHSRGVVKAPVTSVAHERQVEPTTVKLEPIAQPRASSSQAPVKIPPLKQSLLRVDEKYLRADLRKSLIVSLILFAVLIGIFVAVRYNGVSV